MKRLTILAVGVLMTMTMISFAEEAAEKSKPSDGRVMTAAPMISGPYEANWESLKNYKAPKWFRDAKFGLWTHWGPYAVPAFRTEWYSHYMYVRGHEIYKHHVEKYGDPSEFGYKDFIPMFTAEKFDADRWAELFKNAGAKFAGPVSEHADGFAMWDSALTEWDAKEKGPKQDIVGELAKAIRKRGMKFVGSFHHAWHWGWYPTWDSEFDTHDYRYTELYGPILPKPESITAYWSKRINDRFARYWQAKIIEVIDKYHPDLIWFDGHMNLLDDRYREEVLAYYYNDAAKRGVEVTPHYKRNDFVEGTAILNYERGRTEEIADYPWMAVTSVASNSWGYTDDLQYYSAERLLHDLIDIVSKNGCLLLNLAPRADGTFPQEQLDIMKAYGTWLGINGEAIYGTRPWITFGEGPTKIKGGMFTDYHLKGFTPQDIRYTAKDGAIYAIVLGWPEDGQVALTALKKGSGPEKIADIELLGSGANVDWERGDDALKVSLPAEKPCEYAVTLKITE